MTTRATEHRRALTATVLLCVVASCAEGSTEVESTGAASFALQESKEPKVSKEEKEARKQAAKAPEELTGKALKDYRQAELLAHRTALKTEREILKGLETDLAEGAREVADAPGSSDVADAATAEVPGGDRLAEMRERVARREAKVAELQAE